MFANTDREMLFWSSVVVVLAGNVINLVCWAVGVHLPATIFFAGMLLLLAVVAVHRPKQAPWLGVVVVLFVLMILSVPVHEWDPRSIWFFHAKRIFLADDLYAQLDDYAPWSHNDYPVLMPAIAATLARSVGVWNEVFPRLAVLPVVLPVLFVLAESMRSQKVLIVWLAFVMALHGRSEGLISGYLDLPLGYYCAAAGVLLASFGSCAASDSQTLRVSCLRHLFFLLCLVSLSLMKNEGQLAALILLVLYLCVMWRSWQAWFGAVWVFVPLWIFWKLPVKDAGVKGDLFVGDVPARVLGRLADPEQVLLILKHLVSVMGLMVLLLGALALVVPGMRKRIVLPAIFAAIYTAALVLVYLLTPHDLVWHLTSSSSRTFGAVSAMLFCIAFRELAQPGVAGQVWARGLDAWPKLRGRIVPRR